MTMRTDWMTETELHSDLDMAGALEDAYARAADERRARWPTQRRLHPWLWRPEERPAAPGRADAPTEPEPEGGATPLPGGAATAPQPGQAPPTTAPAPDPAVALRELPPPDTEGPVEGTEVGAYGATPTAETMVPVGALALDAGEAVAVGVKQALDHVVEGADALRHWLAGRRGETEGAAPWEAEALSPSAWLGLVLERSGVPAPTRFLQTDVAGLDGPGQKVFAAISMELAELGMAYAALPAGVGLAAHRGLAAVARGVPEGAVRATARGAVWAARGAVGGLTRDPDWERLSTTLREAAPWAEPILIDALADVDPDEDDVRKRLRNAAETAGVVGIGEWVADGLWTLIRAQRASYGPRGPHEADPEPVAEAEPGAAAMKVDVEEADALADQAYVEGEVAERLEARAVAERLDAERRALADEEAALPEWEAAQERYAVEREAEVERLTASGDADAARIDRIRARVAQVRGEAARQGARTRERIAAARADVDTRRAAWRETGVLPPAIPSDRTDWARRQALLPVAARILAGVEDAGGWEAMLAPDRMAAAVRTARQMNLEVLETAPPGPVQLVVPDQPFPTEVPAHARGAVLRQLQADEAAAGPLPEGTAEIGERLSRAAFELDEARAAERAGLAQAGRAADAPTGPVTDADLVAQARRMRQAHAQRYDARTATMPGDQAQAVREAGREAYLDEREAMDLQVLRDRAAERGGTAAPEGEGMGGGPAVSAERKAALLADTDVRAETWYDVEQELAWRLHEAGDPRARRRARLETDLQRIQAWAVRGAEGDLRIATGSWRPLTPEEQALSDLAQTAVGPAARTQRGRRDSATNLIEEDEVLEVQGFLRRELALVEQDFPRPADAPAPRGLGKGRTRPAGDPRQSPPTGLEDDPARYQLRKVEGRGPWEGEAYQRPEVRTEIVWQPPAGTQGVRLWRPSQPSDHEGPYVAPQTVSAEAAAQEVAWLGEAHGLKVAANVARAVPETRAPLQGTVRAVLGEPDDGVASLVVFDDVATLEDLPRIGEAVLADRPLAQGVPRSADAAAQEADALRAWIGATADVVPAKVGVGMELGALRAGALALERSWDTVRAMARQAGAPMSTPEDVVRFADAVDKTRALERWLAGDTAQARRLLRDAGGEDFAGPHADAGARREWMAERLRSWGRHVVRETPQERAQRQGAARKWVQDRLHRWGVPRRDVPGQRSGSVWLRSWAKLLAEQDSVLGLAQVGREMTPLAKQAGRAGAFFRGAARWWMQSLLTSPETWVRVAVGNATRRLSTIGSVYASPLLHAPAGTGLRERIAEGLAQGNAHAMGTFASYRTALRLAGWQRRHVFGGPRARSAVEREVAEQGLTDLFDALRREQRTAGVRASREAPEPGMVQQLARVEQGNGHALYRALVGAMGEERALERYGTQLGVNAIQVADMFGKVMAYRGMAERHAVMRVHGMVRDARARGATVSEAEQGALLVRFREDAMREVDPAALDVARVETMSDAPVPGTVYARFEDWLQQPTLVSQATRVLSFPFFRVMRSELGQVVGRGTVGWLADPGLEKVLRRLKMGGVSDVAQAVLPGTALRQRTPEQLGILRAQQTLSAATLAMGGYLASQGLVTGFRPEGAPWAHSLRSLRPAASLRVGDQWLNAPRWMGVDGAHLVLGATVNEHLNAWAASGEEAPDRDPTLLRKAFAIAQVGGRYLAQIGEGVALGHVGALRDTGWLEEAGGIVDLIEGLDVALSDTGDGALAEWTVQALQGNLRPLMPMSAGQRFVADVLHGFTRTHSGADTETTGLQDTAKEVLYEPFADLAAIVAAVSRAVDADAPPAPKRYDRYGREVTRWHTHAWDGAARTEGGIPAGAAAGDFGYLGLLVGDTDPKTEKLTRLLDRYRIALPRIPRGKRLRPEDPTSQEQLRYTRAERSTLERVAGRLFARHAGTWVNTHPAAVEDAANELGREALAVRLRAIAAQAIRDAEAEVARDGEFQARFAAAAGRAAERHAEQARQALRQQQGG